MNMKTLTETSTFRVLSLLLCLCFFIPAMNVSASSLQADKFKVSGIVKDATGEPVIGASVVEKGTTNGTVTDLDGNFNLTVASNSTIVISFIGYSDQEYRISKDNTVLNVNLKEDTEMIDEVVVVGYGVQKKENLTGSVAAVNFKDVASMPVANTANMLQGRLPGVMLTNNGAQAGHDSPEIRIRGVGTFEHNDPMVLIDGVESSVSQIAEIPADDIESVSVLKDAASASIYGVRAANGVILVTTKRGGEQKPTITYSGSIALQEATVLPDYVNSYEWAKMYNECWPSKAYTDEMLQKLQNGSDPDHFANTDWAKEMFRTAAMHQHHLSVNGGSKAVHYMISTQYFQQDGILRETANQRFNFRSNLDAQLGIVKLGLNLSGSRQNIDEPTTSVTGEGLMRYLTWFTRPTVPVRYSNGHYGFLDHESNQAFGYSGPINNPYAKRYTEPSVNYNLELGTGNIYTSAGDLYQIIKAVNQGKIISTASLKALRNLDNGQYTAGVYNFGSYTLTHGVVASQSAGTMIDTSGQNAVVLLANTDKITQGLIKNLYLNMIKGV